MKLAGVIVAVMLCACTNETTTPVEGESLVLGEWHLAFDPGECGDDTARTGADFRLTPFEDGGMPLIVLVVDGEDVGNAGFLLNETDGRVRYETAYDGDVLDLEIADDGVEAVAFVRYTHAHDCSVETEASGVERIRVGAGVR